MLGEEAGRQPVRNAITDRVYAVLRARIIDLELPPGERLQIERVSRDFDVSPTPVREALNRLTAEGLVVQEPYRGFRVSELLDEGELDQLLTARSVIEAAAVDAAVAEHSEQDVAELRTRVEEMAELVKATELDVKRYNAADAAFHRAVMQMGTNVFLVRAFDALNAHVQISRQFQGMPVSRARHSNEEHEQLVAAIEASDREGASAAVRQHIEAVRTALQDDVVEESA